MFVLITMRCIIDTYRCVIAFDTIDTDFGPPNTTLGLVTNSCWFFVTPIADAFIIFRTFVVWNRNWLVIILPAFLCIANLGPAIWGNIVLKSLNLFLSLTLCTNIICTGLISFRILRIHYQVSPLIASGPSYTMRVMSTIVESAALYTFLLIGTLINNSVNSYINFILFNCTTPTIGLVFSYIIIRVSRGTSYGDTGISIGTMRLGQPNPTTTQTYELDHSTTVRPDTAGAVQVHLSRETETSGHEFHIGKDAAKVMM
ncbi:hypothetical protein DFH08DRAFT_973804 [Mycena albidolilacea]|uniref:Uncharacterized protein n=1 Tax=Mycena albidolilacea TaxID=1033008 RepID=A0AAD6Z8G4_9AGAR|nr:hypothetical protein DFH08DRAFT_973804 [Mycena albidolilacea]